MLYSIEKAENINRKFVGIGEKLKGLFFNLQYNLEQAGIKIAAEKYLTAAFFSGLVYGIVFFFVFYALFFLRDNAISPQNSIFAFLIGIVFSIIFFVIHVIYPKLMAQKYGKTIDQKLVFALKNMLIQVNSGVSLFDAIVNISKADYGNVSKEFAEIAKEVNSGESETKALEKMALKTKSDYLKKTAWQLVSSIKSGASLQKALGSIVANLTNMQSREIKDYSAELNLWILVYLLLAAAVPTLGITFLVILSSLGGAAIGPEHVLLIVFGSFATQIILIGFIKNRVPQVFA